MNELKHLTFNPYWWLLLFTAWVVGIFFGMWVPSLAPYQGYGIVANALLIPFLLLLGLTLKHTKLDYKHQWWKLRFWPLLFSNIHFRKRTWVWLSYAFLLTLSTSWIAFNAVHWSWLVVIITAQALGLALLLLEAEVFIARNYYVLEYAAAIAVLLNLVVVIASIAGIFFLNQWQLPWWMVWGTATLVTVWLGSAYSLVYVEGNTLWIPIILLVLYGVLWYGGLRTWFGQFPWLWLAPVVLYGYLLNVLDIWLYRDNKVQQIARITVLFLLTAIVLLR